MILVALVGQQFDTKVKYLHTEFNLVEEFGSQNGLLHTHSQRFPYTHQQNGRTESLIRRITTLIRTTLLGLGSDFPAELYREDLLLASKSQKWDNP